MCSCFLLLSVEIARCDDEGHVPRVIAQEVYELIVASKKVPGVVYAGCGHSYVTDVYAVKKGNSESWTAHGEIMGFEYEAGKEYHILVEEIFYEDHRRGEPVWVECRLLKVLSERPEISSDVPESLIPEGYVGD